MSHIHTKVVFLLEQRWLRLVAPCTQCMPEDHRNAHFLVTQRIAHFQLFHSGFVVPCQIIANTQSIRDILSIAPKLPATQKIRNCLLRLQGSDISSCPLAVTGQFLRAQLDRFGIDIHSIPVAKLPAKGFCQIHKSVKIRRIPLLLHLQSIRQPMGLVFKLTFRICVFLCKKLSHSYPS